MYTRGTRVDYPVRIHAEAAVLLKSDFLHIQVRTVIALHIRAVSTRRRALQLFANVYGTCRY